MTTKEIIDRIFKEPGVKFELTEFETLGKPIHEILNIYAKTAETRGAIAILDDDLPPKTVCSGAFYVCMANDPRYREIIWLYLRCMKHVFEKYCGGTSYPTIESTYLARFPVPLFDSGIAARISELVVAARQAKRDSECLLEEAKTRVEQLIEEAVNS